MEPGLAVFVLGCVLGLGQGGRPGQFQHIARLGAAVFSLGHSIQHAGQEPIGKQRAGSGDIDCLPVFIQGNALQFFGRPAHAAGGKGSSLHGQKDLVIVAGQRNVEAAVLAFRQRNGGHAHFVPAVTAGIGKGVGYGETLALTRFSTMSRTACISQFSAVSSSMMLTDCRPCQVWSRMRFRLPGSIRQMPSPA